MKEIWKPINGYENLYSVSNLGRVKSHERIIMRNKTGAIPIKEKILNNIPDGNGYLRVNLYLLKVKTRLVHRLVAEAFLNNPDKKTTINHKDGNKENNHVSNLEFATVSENHLHAYATGLMKPNYAMKGRFGKENPTSKLIIQFTQTGEFVKQWDSIAEAERLLGIQTPNIIKCAKGTRNNAGGFKWKYADQLNLK